MEQMTIMASVEAVLWHTTLYAGHGDMMDTEMCWTQQFVLFGLFHAFYCQAKAIKKIRIHFTGNCQWDESNKKWQQNRI